MTDKPDLAALLGSRICHDLIGPIGAIGNGVELLTMDGAGSSPELALISDSVQHANARIRFFRLAFGAAQGEGTIGLREVQDILTDMTRGSRLSVVWTSPTALPRASVKLAFLLILCLESAMPVGGIVTVSASERTWEVKGRAARLKIDTSLWSVLTGGEKPDLQPNQVQFALVAVELQRQQRRLSTDAGEVEVRFSF